MTKMKKLLKEFKFKESKIWNGANPNEIDSKGKEIVIRAKSLERAKKELPQQVGRTWVLVN